MLSTRRSQRLRSSITITIACPRENCRATTRAAIRPLLALGGPDASPAERLDDVFARGMPVTVRVRLSPRARVTVRRALRARERIVAQLHVRVVDDAEATRAR